MSEMERNRAVYQAFSDAWAAGDLAAMMACVSDDMVYSASIGAEPGTTYRGREEVRAGIAAMIARDAATSMITTELHQAGDKLFPLWTYRLPGGGLARGIDVIGFRGGLICRKDAYRKCPD
jgi:ketosteroid isomerase-like protein